MEHIWTSVVSTDGFFLNESLRTADLGKVTQRWPKLPKRWGYH